MAKYDNDVFGGFGDNFDIANASVESLFAKLDGEQEQESPELTEDEDADDMANPTIPETVDFDSFFEDDDEEDDEEKEEKESSSRKRGRKHRSKNIDTMFEDDDDDDDEDKDDDDEKETTDRKRRKRKSKNARTSLEDEDDEEKEEKEEKEDEEKAETESKRRKCKAYAAVAKVAAETADDDDNVDPAVESFAREIGMIPAVGASASTESFGLFDGIVKTKRGGLKVEALQKAHFDASFDLEDHYRKLSAGM